MLLFSQTQIIVSTRLPAPSLYTAAPVSMIGYTTYTFRHWGSDFLVRATEMSTSRYRITALPYQFFPFYHRKTLLPIAQTASPSADATCFPRKSKKMYQMSVLWSQIPRLINTYTEKFSSLTYFYPPVWYFWKCAIYLQHIYRKWCYYLLILLGAKCFLS